MAFRIQILISIHIIFRANAQVDTYTADSLTCKLCPPGTHWEGICEVNNGPSKCRPCAKDTYSSSENQADRCAYCKICPIGTSEKTPCTWTNDRTCECSKGKYWYPLGGGQGKCKHHSKCPNDQIVIQPGTAEEDTKCGKSSMPGHDGGITEDDTRYEPTDVPGYGGSSSSTLWVVVVISILTTIYAIHHYRVFRTPRA